MRHGSDKENVLRGTWERELTYHLLTFRPARQILPQYLSLQQVALCAHQLHHFIKMKKCQYSYTQEYLSAVHRSIRWVFQSYSASYRWPEWSLKRILAVGLPLKAYGNFYVLLEWYQSKPGSRKAGGLVNSVVSALTIFSKITFS